MRVRLLTVSQRQPSWVISACAEYEKRMPRAWQFEVLEIKPEARTSGVTRQKVQAAESIRIKNAVPKGALVVALDERGESWTTERFAEKIEGWQQIGRDLAFVIGGADGLDPQFRRQADQCLSLSKMVMPHGLVRVVMVEQLYRAAKVIDGHPYHK